MKTSELIKYLMNELINNGDGYVNIEIEKNTFVELQVSTNKIPWNDLQIISFSPFKETDK